MFLHKLAIGLGSLVILHPVVKLFGFNWEQTTVDVDAIAAAEGNEMSTHVYQNGVLFGVWVAGVAISIGRLLSYVIYGGGAPKNGVDEQTQTEEDEPVSQEVKEIQVINQESYTKFTEAKPVDIEEPIKTEELIEIEEPIKIEELIKIEEPIKIEELIKIEEPIKIEQLGGPANDEETIPLEKVSREGKGEGSKIVAKLDEKEDKAVKSETKISVYKLPAIKRHSFMVIEDGMKALRQSVQGKFSLEKITLDGVRNFIFIVAKGTPTQLSDLESKVKADFRWLTPVRDPPPKLTGVRAPPINQEPKWISSPKANDPSSRIPAPRTAISPPRARSPTRRAGLPHKTPNPNTMTQK